MRRFLLPTVLGVVLACGPAVMPISTTPTSSTSPPTATSSTALLPNASSAPSTTVLVPDAWPIWQQFDLETLEPIVRAPVMELGWPANVVPGPGGLVATTYLQDILPENKITTVLRVVQTATGTQVAPDVRLDHLVWPGYPFGPEDPPLIRFDPAGGFLYWAHQRTGLTVDEGWDLYRYPLQSGGRAEVIYQFQAPFEPWDFRVLGDDRVAVFEVAREDPANPIRWPRLLLLDGATGDVIADTLLEGLLAGDVLAARGAERVRPGLAWDLTASRLYVVHADQDRVAVLDLASGSLLADSNFAPAFTWSLLPAASAKSSQGVARNVLLSPAGDRLYVTGVRTDLDEGGYEHQSGMGLQVIDTANLVEVGSIDLPVTDAAISPDGRLLLLTGISDRLVVDQDAELSGLYLVDTGTLEVIDHRHPDSFVRPVGFSPTGQDAYISWFDKSSNVGTLYRLDTTTLEVGTERSYQNLINVEAGLMLVEMPPSLDE